MNRARTPLKGRQGVDLHGVGVGVGGRGRRCFTIIARDGTNSDGRPSLCTLASFFRFCERLRARAPLSPTRLAPPHAASARPHHRRRAGTPPLRVGREKRAARSSFLLFSSFTSSSLSMPLSSASAPDNRPVDLSGYWRVVKAEGLDAWLKVKRERERGSETCGTCVLDLHLSYLHFHPHPHTGGRLPLGPAPPRHGRRLQGRRHHPHRGSARPGWLYHPPHHDRQRARRVDADRGPRARHRPARRRGPAHPHVHLVGGRRAQDPAQLG